QGSRVDTYRELQRVLQGSQGCLPGGVVNRLVAEASGDLRAAQGVAGEVKMAAGDVLVALACSHCHFVLPELQSHLMEMGEVPEEAVLLTLDRMARSYALQCIPFLGSMLHHLGSMLGRVRSGRILCLLCSAVLEHWCKGVWMYLAGRDQGPSPCPRAAQLCADIASLFPHVMVNSGRCQEEEEKQAVLRAAAAMLGVLLHEEQHREQAWRQLSWLLRQYQEVQDISQATKSLRGLLEMLAGAQIPVPRGTALAISSAVHRQVREPLRARSKLPANAQGHFFPAAQICPEETVAFLLARLSGGHDVGRVAALRLLGALVHVDAPAMREKLPQVVDAVQSVCNEPSFQVRRAVLEFIRELLGSGCQRCWAWDVVGHLFHEFSRTWDGAVRAE
ncbi:MRO2A protein, partial [Centropus bengalensis]|nr:MRO2A protein [Centropus bengalensis]